MSIAFVLVAAALVMAAGGFTIGFAPTLTLLAVAATVGVFYLLIQISRF